MQRQLQDYQLKFNQIKHTINYTQLKEELNELEERTSDPNLWNNKKEFPELLTKIKLIKGDIENIDQMEKLILDISFNIELLNESEWDVQDITSITKEANDIGEELEKLFSEWALRKLLSGPYDSGSAYITIQVK